MASRLPTCRPADLLARGRGEVRGYGRQLICAEAAEVLAVSPRMTASTGFLAPLGLAPAQHPSAAGEHIPADPAGRTRVPGVWVAGNVTDLSAQVGPAAAAGALAAAHINADLVTEETRQAVAAQSAQAKAGPR